MVMKTAISIPDPLFEKAEKLARRLRISRSELFSRAVRALVEAHDRKHITETLNGVYDGIDSAPDPVLTTLQALGTAPEDW